MNHAWQHHRRDVSGERYCESLIWWKNLVKDFRGRFSEQDIWWPVDDLIWDAVGLATLREGLLEVDAE